MSGTTNLGLPFIEAAQAQKHVTHNDALLALDAVCQAAVLDRDLSTPPASPGEGQRWLIGPNPLGAWAGKAGWITAWQDGAWRFYQPRAGWVAFVVDELSLAYFNGQAWVSMSVGNALQNLTLLGLGTSADAANPLSAKLNKALFTARTVAEGGDGDLRYTLNKEALADVVSLLFQTGFSARAELGLVGDDKVRLKVSSNGQSFADALVANGDGSLSYPSQPRCSVIGYSVVGAAAPYKVAFTTVKYNARGCYDTGTGRFTAPAPGDYEFGLSMLTGNTAAGAELFLHKNGVSQGRIAYLNPIAGAEHRQIVGIAGLSLAAGDTVEVVTHSPPANWYATPELFNSFTGRLVG